MKIFVTLNNYNTIPTRDHLTGWYCLPDSTVLKSGNPLFLPPAPRHLSARLSVVYRLDRLGKGISERFAHRYYAEASMAVVLSDEELKAELQAQSLPLTPALMFDRCLLLGDFVPLDELAGKIWHMHVGQQSIDYDLSKITVPIDRQIALYSESNTLKMGDLILGGLSDESVILTDDTHLTVSDNSNQTTLLDINIK